MSFENYLLAANVLVWVGIAGYVAVLGGKSAAIERRLRQLEILGGEDGR